VGVRNLFKLKGSCTKTHNFPLNGDHECFPCPEQLQGKDVHSLHFFSTAIEVYQGQSGKKEKSKEGSIQIGKGEIKLCSEIA
jgi:hypothetical protein